MAKINGVVARCGMDEYRSDFVHLGDLEIDPNEPCYVQQSDYDRSDINLIVERFIRTGVLESVRQTQGQYGDFSEVSDYASCLRQLQQAEESFMSLPATVRKKFDNDPGQFLEFVGDPANLPEMAKMGLLKEGYVSPSDSAKASEGSAEAAPKG